MAPLRSLACLAAVVSGVLLSACGDDGGSSELRSRDASSLRATLTDVEQRVADQDCAGATQEAAALRAQVDELPERVPSKLREALASSADRLESLVADQCSAAPVEPAPEVGTTSEDPAQGTEDTQTDEGKKDKKPKKEKPNPDETQTQPPPETGGAGEEVPGVGNQGDGTSPEE